MDFIFNLQEISPVNALGNIKSFGRGYHRLNFGEIWCKFMHFKKMQKIDEEGHPQGFSHAIIFTLHAPT
jgi:hypothetical protein